MSFDAVLKIGGSLSRGAALPALCREISRLGKSHSMLVVPGGGGFADQVRAADRRYHLDATAAHRMALLAMDQYGYLLNHLVEGSVLVTDLECARRSAISRRVAVLLPSALVAREDPLPHSWQVTSDSIAAWVAHRVCCNRAVLLKDVDGLLNSEGIIEELTVEDLAGHCGGVDEHLPSLLSSLRVETWVISGLHPERVSELLRTGRTTGTRVKPWTSPIT